jgi:hypothetical protein
MFNAAGVKGAPLRIVVWGIGAYIFAASLKAEDIITEPKAKESPSDSWRFVLCQSNGQRRGDAFWLEEQLNKSLIPSIQRAAHKLKNKSATTSARSRTTRSEARTHPRCVWCIIFSHVQNERRRLLSNQKFERLTILPNQRALRTLKGAVS